MRLNQTTILRKILTAFLVLSVPIAFISGCSFGGLASSWQDTNTRLEQAINSIDRAIGTLSQQSANWQVALYDLEKEVSEDLQSTLRTEVHNLTQSAIMAASSELRCNSEYIRVRLRNDLIKLRNDLASRINGMVHLGSNGLIPLLPEADYDPFVCDAVPAKVDLNLTPDRRTQIDIYGFDFKAQPIKASIVRYGIFEYVQKNVSAKSTRTLQSNLLFSGAVIDTTHQVVQKEGWFKWSTPSLLLHKDVTRALSVISDFHAVLDLSEIAAELTPNAREIILSSGEKIISEIPIVTHQNVLSCDTRTISLENLGKQTFVPPKVKNGADADFAGHGPYISFALYLYITSDQKNLKAYIYMDAYECKNDGTSKSDYTEARGSKTITLYSAQEDEKLVSFDVKNHFQDAFIYNNDHEPLVQSYGGNAPVSEITYTGDTKGKEAGTRTKAEIVFREINLQVEKCELK